MGKKYSFTSFITNPINFILTIKNPNANVQNFDIRYKITHEFTAFIEKYSAAMGWILRLKVPKIKMTSILSLLSNANSNLKVNKIQILTVFSSIFSLIETLKVKKILINAVAKLMEKWTETLKVTKITLTNVSILLAKTSSALKINKVSFVGDLNYIQYPLLSYYDSVYMDGYLDSMDVSYLSALDSLES